MFTVEEARKFLHVAKVFFCDDPIKLEANGEARRQGDNYLFSLVDSQRPHYVAVGVVGEAGE